MSFSPFIMFKSGIQKRFEFSEYRYEIMVYSSVFNAEKNTMKSYLKYTLGKSKA